MSTLKAISAAVIFSATIAAPAFAQAVYGPYARGPYGPGPYYWSYGQAPGDYLPPQDTDEYWNLVNHGFTGRDISRPGSESPSLNPSGS